MTTTTTTTTTFRRLLVARTASLLLLVVAATASTSTSTYTSTWTAGPSHYEEPPCRHDDERAVQIMGVDGVFCSPSCATAPCPADVPDGVTAVPSCALQSPTGDKYCAVLCQPQQKQQRNEDEDESSHSSSQQQCGPMTCRPIPQAQGIGICVYPTTKDGEGEEREQGGMPSTSTTVVNYVMDVEKTIA